MMPKTVSRRSVLMVLGGSLAAGAVGRIRTSQPGFATARYDVDFAELGWTGYVEYQGWILTAAEKQRLSNNARTGETWQSLDGSGLTGLPDIPVHSIVVDPDDRQRLYLGTDLGVMVSIDGGATWRAEETGFGPAVTMWLSLIRTPAGQKQLFAFTHGRGAWRVTLR